MNPLTALALLVAAATASPPESAAHLPREVSEALSQALTVPGGRIVPLGWTGHLPAGCHLRQVTLSGPVNGSARLPVKLYGQGCSGWGWVRFEVWAPTAQTTRPVRTGELLQPALAIADREIRSGRVGIVPPPGAVAARDLPRGIVLEPTHVAGSALAPGENVKVILVSGGLAIETKGRAISCGSGRICAILPTGRHVEGRLEEGRLLVDLP
jgi:hypothetical protein